MTHGARLLAVIRDMAQRRMGEIAEGVSAAMGVTVAFDYRRCFPATINSPAESEEDARRGRQRGPSVPTKSCRYEPPSMTAEDFAFMLEARPRLLYLAGPGRRGP